MSVSLVLNRIADDQVYKSTYPQMKGKGAAATHELHIFLADLNPSEQRLEQYYTAVNDWNKLHPELTDKMKACFLALVFRSPSGDEQTVKVMQSARYFRSDDSDQVVRNIHEDADFFVSKGFSVVREKVEASAYGIEGIPQTDEETKVNETKYFEFHIKVGSKEHEDNQPLDDKEIEKLKAVSRQFTEQFSVPVPLSYNCNKDGVSGDGQGYQRFLNVRFRDQGIDTIKPKLDLFKNAIDSVGLKVIKTISEYVWYDSFTQLDKGWIDYTAEEEKALVSLRA